MSVSSFMQFIGVLTLTVSAEYACVFTILLQYCKAENLILLFKNMLQLY